VASGLGGQSAYAQPSSNHLSRPYGPSRFARPTSPLRTAPSDRPRVARSPRFATAHGPIYYECP